MLTSCCSKLLEYDNAIITANFSVLYTTANIFSNLFLFNLFCFSICFFFFFFFQISGVEVVIFLFYYNSNNFYEQEKVVVMGDCCYVNPMVRRTVRFLGNVRPAQNIPTID